MADYSKKDVEGFSYEVIKPIGVLSERNIQGERWTLEANLIAWNHKPPKWDIRSWNSTHSHMSKGITLSFNEADKLAELIMKLGEGRES